MGWQDSFNTENPEDVAPLAQQRGLVIEWDIRGENRFLRTRYYISAFEYFPLLDKNVLYASVADDFMWFDSWPGIGGVTPVDEQPLRLVFGDGTDMTQDEKQQFVDIYDRFGFPVKWAKGEIVVLCNYRFAHGRPIIPMAPTERRILGVILGKTFDRRGASEEAW